jgi:hypothetical protein
MRFLVLPLSYFRRKERMQIFFPGKINLVWPNQTFNLKFVRPLPQHLLS